MNLCPSIASVNTFVCRLFLLSLSISLTPSLPPLSLCLCNQHHTNSYLLSCVCRRFYCLYMQWNHFAQCVYRIEVVMGFNRTFFNGQSDVYKQQRRKDYKKTLTYTQSHCIRNKIETRKIVIICHFHGQLLWSFVLI